MILVNKITEGIRLEGVNYGLPMTFILLGDGFPYDSAEDLVREVLLKSRNRWVCLKGEGTTMVGMGAVMKGIAAIGIQIEVECSGSMKDPGYLHTVDRWIVDYVENNLFNYSALRPQDMVRFFVEDVGDLGEVEEGLERLKTFPGTKYIKSKKINPRILKLLQKYDRCRFYEEK